MHRSTWSWGLIAFRNVRDVLGQRTAWRGCPSHEGTRCQLAENDHDGVVWNRELHRSSLFLTWLPWDKNGSTQLRTFQGHSTTGHWLPLNWCPWQGMRNRTAKYTVSIMCYVRVRQVASVVSDSLCPIDYSPPGFSVHGDSPGKKAGMGCHALLQGIVPTEGLNLWLSHYRWICYHWAIREAHVLYSFQSFGCVWLFVTPWTAAHQASVSITNTQSLLKRMSVESVMPPNHLILCHPPLLLHLIFPRIRIFPNESVLHIRWPKYWSFNFSISTSNEYSGLISFRIDWFHLLAVHGMLKGLLQHHSSKVSILRCSPFFMVQVSHPYMTTGNTIALTRRTWLAK